MGPSDSGRDYETQTSSPLKVRPSRLLFIRPPLVTIGLSGPGHGGLTVVQEPSTALYPEMPQHAIASAGAHYVLQLDEIAPFLAKVGFMDRIATTQEEPMERTKIAWTCPECRGPLWEERQGRIVEYRCRVGHSYSPLHMVKDHEETVERSLWSTIVALEEAAEIAEKIAPELGSPTLEEARKKRAQAETLRGMLTGTERTSPVFSQTL